MEFYQKHENTSDIHGIFICLKIQGNSKLQFANLPFERGEILFSKVFFYLYGYSQTTR